MNSIIFFPAFRGTVSVASAQVSQLAVGGSRTCLIRFSFTYSVILILLAWAPEYLRVEV
ncbi:hypothetical protein D3C75_1321900 [compost metagenome]